MLTRTLLTSDRIASAKVPTWITPLALIVVTSVLIPGSSFLGHLCAVTIGYLCMYYRDPPIEHH